MRKKSTFLSRNAFRAPVVIWSVILALLVAGTVLAQPGPGEPSSSGQIYGLAWWTMESGGGASTTPGGEYALVGTIGQPDAADLRGQLYSLTGGFWGRTTGGSESFQIYLPLVIRDA